MSRVFFMGNLTQEIKTASLVIGQVLVDADRCNRRAIYDMDRDENGNIRFYRSVGLRKPTFLNHDTHIRPVSDIFGIGFYYTDEIVSQAEIDAAIETATVHAQNEEKAAEARKQKFVQDVARQPFEHPHLEPLEMYENRLGKRHQERNCAAANIRKELKLVFPSVNFRVHGDHSSINISWTDGPKRDEVAAYTSRYSHGYYDSNEDYHGIRHSPFTRVFGSAEFVFVDRTLTADAVRRAWIEGGFNPDSIDRDGENGLYSNDYPTHEQIMRNAYDTSFCAPIPPLQSKPVNKTPVKRSTDSSESKIPFKIEKHYHTKGGFDMFLVQLPERVDGDIYKTLLSAARALFGWYSRKWGATPAGFAFKKEETAAQFVRDHMAPTFAPAATWNTEPETPAADIKRAVETVEQQAKTPKRQNKQQSAPDGTKTAAKLRKLADGMQAAIDGKFADRQTNTAKRLAQAEHARLEGEQMQRTQTALYALADLHEQGEVPDVLRKFTAKKDIYSLMYSKKESVPNGYHSFSRCTGKPYHNTPEAVALWALLSPTDPKEVKARELRRLLQGVQFSKIPGFFPTPAPVVKRMLSFLDLEPGHVVADTSAGTGNLVAACLEQVPDIKAVACEVNYSLAEILTARFEGAPVRVVRGDFMAMGAELGAFDRAIINPPFESKQDIAHIEHMRDLLKPGGIMVALCAAGPRQEAALRGLADHWEILPAGSFKEAGTGVSVALGVYRK